MSRTYEKPKTPTHPRVCEQCGSNFLAVTPTRRFCSHNCCAKSRYALKAQDHRRAVLNRLLVESTRKTASQDRSG